MQKPPPTRRTVLGAVAAWAVAECSASDDVGSTDDAEELVVSVLPRDAWGAAPTRTGGTTHGIERLTVHRGANALRTNDAAPAQLRRLQTAQATPVVPAY